MILDYLLYARHCGKCLRKLWQKLLMHPNVCALFFFQGKRLGYATMVGWGQGTECWGVSTSDVHPFCLGTNKAFAMLPFSVRS